MHPQSQPQPLPSPMQRNVSAVAHLEQQHLLERSFTDRVSDALTQATGSTPFVVLHAGFFAAWILINTGSMGRFAPFDPYPFSFLTLVVSLEAIFLSVFVLMSQNRMTRIADQRARLDLQIDLLAERELTMLLRMLRALCEKEGVCEGSLQSELRDLLKDTDVDALASKLDENMPST
jgi:uncharacterized membrane protein